MSATRHSSRRRSKQGKSTHEIPFGSIGPPGRHRVPRSELGRPQRRPSRACAAQYRPARQRRHRRHHDGLAACVPTRWAPMGLAAATSRGCRQTRDFNWARSGPCSTPWFPTPATGGEAGVFRDGLELNHPLICRNVLLHPGALPNRWGLLDVSNPNVVVSSLKPTRDGDVALRIYEASGRPAAGVTIKLRARVLAAHEANLMEDQGAPLKTVDDGIRLDLGPFEIKTIRLRLEGAKF